MDVYRIKKAKKYNSSKKLELHENERPDYHEDKINCREVQEVDYKLETTVQPGRYGSHEVVTMENDYFSVTVRPADGGRIVGLLDKQTGCPLIWTNERTTDVFRHYSCNYDDLSNGGVEEAFPTVQPCTIGDAQLPFFGEVWNVPWRVLQTKERLTLSCYSPVFPARLEKSFYFSRDGQALISDYCIQNIGAEPFAYVFGVHPSLTLYEDSILVAPQEEYALYVSMPDKVEGIPVFSWPAYRDIDFRYAKPKESLACYNLVSMPTSGTRYGLLHPSRGTGLMVEYDPAFFRCLSLWPIYGGVRGLRCLMSEVFTAWPAGLDAAIERDLAYTLNPGAMERTSITYRLTRDQTGGAK